MKLLKTGFGSIGIVFLFGFLLSGCVGAYMAAALAPSIMMVGGSLYSAIESADISASISPQNKGEVMGIKTIAVISSQRVSGMFAQSAFAGVPHLTAGMINSINTTFENEGLKTISTFELEQNLSNSGVAMKVDQSGAEYYSKNDMIKSAFQIGADAVLVGSGILGSEMKTSGFFVGGGSVQSATTVKSMNARLINEQGKSLMTVNLSYKKGQPDQEAGNALGLIVVIKIQNPDVDVKAEVKKRGAKG